MKESYSDLKHKLDEIIIKIQDPTIELDDALRLHEQGQKIIEKLEKYLSDVKLKIPKTK